ncbi:MAG: hypothetical protein JSU70_09570 [Phycisphaerales bacterium]|nr:MAG: hypothetical protein JSU70_09570 [Phycisphaerales bacterium]
MDESITSENRQQKRQKPPRSLARIACEILTGAATAAALAYISLGVVGYGAKIAGLGEGCMDGLAVLGMMAMVVPPVYVLGCAIGVYFVGRIGSQTGSFWVTLGGVFLGVPIAALLLFYMWAAEEYTTLGIEKIIIWPLVFLAPPSGATLGFNLTRRYKRPPSS